jgi:Flp pilus assembly protein TadG
MMLNGRGPKRRGATVIESAIVLPATFILFLVLIVGGLGIFRYQEVASLAREGARWASVHGGQCVREANPSSANPTLTSSNDIMNNAVQPNAVILDPASLSCTASWTDASQMPAYLDYSQTPPAWKTNTVTVTVQYQWIPEMYLGGITLSSTSVMPISY